MKTFIYVFLSTVINFVLAGQVFAHDVNQHQIAAAMKKIFDKPEAPLSVPSISVEGDYAVAGWVQGERGGRAFLQKLNGHWIIKACAGSALTQGESIQSLGMQPDTANKLAKAVMASESNLDQHQRHLFDSFDGTVMIDAQGDHHGEHAGHMEHAEHAGMNQQ